MHHTIQRQSLYSWLRLLELFSILTVLFLPSFSVASTFQIRKIPQVKLINHGRSSRNNENYFNRGENHALYESDFEMNDDAESDDCDDRLACANNFPRGGGSIGAGIASKLNVPKIQTFGSSSKQPERKTRQIKKQQRNKIQQLQLQLQKQRSQKMRQFRKLFRLKQREFQDAMYQLNSRIYRQSSYIPFPRPPYQQWQMSSEPHIGQTSLTGKIFLINIAIFGLQTAFPSITAMGAKRSDLLLEGKQLYRLLTPVFLHGGIGHLMANSYSLKSMGKNVERAFGPGRFIATYLVSGIAGNIVSAIQSPNPAVGASGAIFGLVGAYYTFLSRNADLFGNTAESQKAALVETIGINLLLGMTNPMIDNWGHIGGFIGGVGMAYLIGPKLYVARIPPLVGTGEDGPLGGAKVVIDRPTFVIRTPEIVEEGIHRMDENMRLLGRRVTASVRGLIGGGGLGDQELFFSRNSGNGGVSGIDTSNEIISSILSGEVSLDGNNIHVTPSDGFRQNVSELKPNMTRQRQRRKSTPKIGRSLRPRYGHLYQ